MFGPWSCGKTRNVRFSPTITGSFDSHGELLDDKSMKCGVNVTANQIVKEGLAGVKLYIDSVQELGGAKIDRVKDLTTGKTDGTVTPGGMVKPRTLVCPVPLKVE